MLERYINKFSNLRTDRNRHRWSPLTCHQAPHKPFLLMSVMDNFAQGGVGTEYEVLVSKVVTINQNYPGHILTLSDRNIIRPAKVEFWPNQDNLEWHREKVYCR